MSAATIEAEVEAKLHAEWLAAAEAELGSIPEYRREFAETLLKEMRKTSATITRCAERMQTCKPAARFTYSAHITKAKRKFSWAHTDFQRLT